MLFFCCTFVKNIYRKYKGEETYMNEFLKVYTYESRMGKAIEGYLHTNYPEAEVKWGKKGDKLIMKRTVWERLVIRFIGDPVQKSTRVTFHYMRWKVKGVHYGLMGVWPTLIALTDSDGLEESLAEGLGRYLGLRYWVRVECLRPRGLLLRTLDLVFRRRNPPYSVVGILFKP